MSLPSFPCLFQAKISLLKRACKEKDELVGKLSEEIQKLRHSIATSALDDMSKIRSYGYSPENFVKLSAQREKERKISRRDPEVGERWQLIIFVLLEVEAQGGSLFKCRWHLSHFNDIPSHEPPFQASSSPLPKIRMWSTRCVDLPLWQHFTLIMDLIGHGKLQEFWTPRLRA